MVIFFSDWKQQDSPTTELGISWVYRTRPYTYRQEGDSDL